MQPTPSQPLKEQIRQARGKFLAMAGSYALGVFNDNFFKEAAMLIALATGRGPLQAYAAVIFTLPFILFAAPAGWMADRFPKRYVVIGSKALELAAMICGAIGIVLGDWTLVFVMLGIMATQSAIFSPALNGSIPELYPDSYVLRANSLTKMATTASILLGLAVAGPALDVPGAFFGVDAGRATVAAGVVLIALAGLAVSLGVPSRPAANPAAVFPRWWLATTARNLWNTRKDRLFAVVLLADAYIWFIASLQVLAINAMGLQQFGFSKSLTSLLVAAEMVGVAVGGLVSSFCAVGPKWYRVLWPAGCAMSVLMFAMPAVPNLPEPLRVPVISGLLGALGLAGGVFLIPLESFIQVRPPAHRKGVMIAAGNFVAFCGILLSGLASNLLLYGNPLAVEFKEFFFTPTASFAVMGFMTLAISAWLLLVMGKGRLQ